MKKIILMQSEKVIHWLAGKLGEKPCDKAIGIGLESNGELQAGVVFESSMQNSVCMHVASNGTRHWMTPAFLAFCFRYPFLQLKCERITGLVRADNMDAQRFDEHLGFVREGRLRRACTDGTDLIVYGMLKEECRFLTGKYYAAYIDFLGVPGSTDFSLSQGAGEESP